MNSPYQRYTSATATALTKHGLRKPRALPGLLTAWALTLILPASAMAGEVSLSGEGAVRYQPDSARLTFSATATHQNSKQATEAVQQKMSRWHEGISAHRSKLMDYNDADVTLYTRTLAPSKDGEKGKRQSVAAQNVSFSINDLSLLNPLLEQAQKTGMEYRLGNEQFFHSDEAELEQQALAAAIADARKRCDFVALQFERKCGEVMTINIDGGHRPGPMMMMSADASPETKNISSVGQREISAQVNATFKLD